LLQGRWRLQEKENTPGIAIELHHFNARVSDSYHVSRCPWNRNILYDELAGLLSEDHLEPVAVSLGLVGCRFFVLLSPAPFNRNGIVTALPPVLYVVQQHLSVKTRSAFLLLPDSFRVTVRKKPDFIKYFGTWSSLTYTERDHPALDG
jgi:hypothetical protein